MRCDACNMQRPYLIGLGQIDPVSMSLAIADAKHLWDDLLKALGIGAGRREADVITPLQDKLTATVLVPTVEMGSHPELHTCAEMQKELADLNAAYSQFKTFLTTTKWADGRAAKQALYWLEGGVAPPGSEGQQPTAYLVKRDFTEDVQQKCGTGTIGGTIGGILTTPTGEVNWPLVAAGGAVLYFLVRKK